MFDKIEKAEPVADSGFDDPEMEMYSVGYSDGLNDGEEWGWSLVDAMKEELLIGGVESALGLIERWNHMR